MTTGLYAGLQAAAFSLDASYTIIIKAENRSNFIVTKFHLS